MSAATVESTPPLSPQTTRPSPTCALTRAVASSTNDAIVQSPVHPQTPYAKFRRISRPNSRVHDLGMKQQRVQRARVVHHRRDRRVRARRDDGKPPGRSRHEVAVARPDPDFRRHAGKQRRRPGDRDQRVAEFALTRRRDRAAERVRHQLHAVADAQHRDADVEHGRVALRRAGVGHALRTARQDDAGRTPRANLLGRCVRRPDLRVHRELAKPTRDELCVLRPEVENDDGLVAHRNDPPGACRRSGVISRYYSGVAIRLTTICCSALALITALTGVGSAQTRRVKQTYAADDRTPLPLFPLQTLWTLRAQQQPHRGARVRRDPRLLPARRRPARRVRPDDRRPALAAPRSTPRSSRRPATTSCSSSRPGGLVGAARRRRHLRVGTAVRRNASRSRRCGTTAGSWSPRPAARCSPSARPTARCSGGATSARPPMRVRRSPATASTCRAATPASSRCASTPARRCLGTAARRRRQRHPRAATIGSTSARRTGSSTA